MNDLAFNLIMDCGQAMLANGGEVFRAQDTMEIMARSFGIVDFHVYVLTNGIFASAQNGTVSAVRHVPAVSTNLGHVEAINAISRRVADGELDLNSAQLEFERMKRMPTLSPLYNCAAATMGAGCFAMLFGGGLPEMLVGALGGLLASASSCALSKHHISRIFRDTAFRHCLHADRFDCPAGLPGPAGQLCHHRRADGADPRRCLNYGHP